jgi:hypothetical protein
MYGTGIQGGAVPEGTSHNSAPSLDTMLLFGDPSGLDRRHWVSEEMASQKMSAVNQALQSQSHTLDSYGYWSAFSLILEPPQREANAVAGRDSAEPHSLRLIPSVEFYGSRIRSGTP